MNILYVGSGISALQALDSKYDGWCKICVNNAWRLFVDSEFDTWIHSGDFPKENYPTIKNYNQEISHAQYSNSLTLANTLLEWGVKYPEHHAGYTIFFQGLYHIMIKKSPEVIGLLGFDHDYNMDKVLKWKNDNIPNIQNNFNNKLEGNVQNWSAEYFKDFRGDFFYGHGIPDPLRFDEDLLKQKFELAKESAKKLNIKLVNLSGVNSKINTIPQGR